MSAKSYETGCRRPFRWETCFPSPLGSLTPLCPCRRLCRVGGAALPPPSPLRTVRDHFQSHGSSLSFAPCGTRFHHGQTSVMHLPMTVGVEEDEIVRAVFTAFCSPDDVMTVPSLDLGDRLVADGTDAPLFLPEMEQLPFPGEVGLHLDRIGKCIFHLP